MSCFWDALAARLTDGERLRVFGVARRSPDGLLAWVRRVAGPTPGVRVNGALVTPQQQTENTDRIRAITGVHNGYDCSGFDPVLILLAHALRWRVVHAYAGALIHYDPPLPLRTVRLSSSRSHAY